MTKQQVGIAPINRNSTQYEGIQFAVVPCFQFTRTPTTSDIKYPLLSMAQVGHNPSTGTEGDMYVLALKANNLAKWVKIASVAASGDIETLTGNSGGAVGIDANSNINLVGGTGIIAVGVPGSNKITFNAAGGGLSWTDVTTATQTIAVNNGYISNRGGGVTYTLPATASEGDVIAVAYKTGAWSIIQAASQQILIGSSSTTAGVGGSIASNTAGDCVTLLCITGGASTIWREIMGVGSPTIV